MEKAFCKDVHVMAMMAKETAARKDSLPNINYCYAPTREIDNIPLEWFKAAESVLIDYNEEVTCHQVKRLASDAYRQFVMGQSL